MSATNPIEHVVVVMLENRSYDNVLGWLYASNNAPPFVTPPPGQAGLDGLDGSETNPDPYTPGATIAVGNQTTATSLESSDPGYSPTTIPIIDPGEPFDDMAQQITSSASVPTQNPYVNWNPQAAGLMQGFTTNYAKAISKNTSHIADVMNYLTPAQLPVTAFLANNYAVCDSWFASVPTQTFSNRVFGHCAAPGVAQSVSDYFSLIDDLQYLTDSLVELPSILSYLDQNYATSPSWKIYFHDYSISIMTVPYVANIASSTSNVNISTYDTSDWGSGMPNQLNQHGTLPSTFVDDVTNGTLPPYSFIEPRYSDTYSDADPPPAPNCNHPGASGYISPLGISDTNAPIDAASGELLLMNIYNTLRNSPYWDSTLMIVTYDEHGGVFDHVPPPVATPPGTVNWGGQASPPFTVIPAASDIGDKASDGFTFNVFGGRVPALAISKYIAQGTTLSPPGAVPFDHASLVRTVLDCFGFSGDSLNARDQAAPSVMLAVDASVANPTGAFAGTIVPAPSSLVFELIIGEDSKTSLIQASAGGTPLTVSTPTADSWLTASIAAATGPAAIQAITVTVDKSGLRDGTYTSSVTISGAGLGSVEVMVSLVVEIV